MPVTAEDVRTLREETGAGMLDCKKALEESGGDKSKAKDILNKKGFDQATKRADREVSEGLVQSYIHHNNKVGVLVEVNCESDFVSRTDDFKNLVAAVALHIAGANPKYLAKEDMPKDEEEEAKAVVLLEQPYIRDESMTIGELLTQTIAKTGENIRIKRFARFELGRV